MRFEVAFVALSGASVLGLYLDGWAHNNIQGIETFFTPWHAVMYAAFLGVTTLTAAVFFENRARGLRLSDCLPVGYGLSLVGVVIYAIAGMGDFVWHSLFGIEARVEALLSPTHLGLLVGAALFRTGPLRAAWQRPGVSGWRGLWPMLLSATYLLASLTFFTQYVNPLGLTPAAIEYAPGVAASSVATGAMSPDESVLVVGIVSIVLQSALFMAVALLLILRFGPALPFGSFTLVLGVNAVLMTLMRARFLSTGPLPLIAVALLAGLAADVLLLRFPPSAARLGATRALSFALPSIFSALYFAAIFVFAGGVWWSLPVWTGLIVLSGAVGWLVSFIALPPPVHTAARA